MEDEKVKNDEEVNLEDQDQSELNTTAQATYRTEGQGSPQK